MLNSVDILAGEADTGVGYISRKKFEDLIGGNVANVAQNNEIL